MADFSHRMDSLIKKIKKIEHDFNKNSNFLKKKVVLKNIKHFDYLQLILDKSKEMDTSLTHINETIHKFKEIFKEIK